MIKVIDVLKALRAWNHWRYIFDMRKYNDACGSLITGYQTSLTSLKRASRNTIRRLIERYHLYDNVWICLYCSSEFKYMSGDEGDHLIPISWIKELPSIHQLLFYSFENFIPLCRKCNIDKRDRDLIRWWIEEGRSIWDLDNDVFCINLRLLYRYAEIMNDLNKDIIWSRYTYLLRLFKQIRDGLPNKCLEVWKELIGDELYNMS